MTTDNKGLPKAESMFATNEEGKPLCERCGYYPIIGESVTGTKHEWLCFKCMEQDYFDSDENEVDEDLICCTAEMEAQSK